MSASLAAAAVSTTTTAIKTIYVPTVFDNIYANDAVNGKTVNLGLWDTARKKNLLLSLKWVLELQHYSPNVPIVLVGTKLDLRENKFPMNYPGACTTSIEH
ncbi:unnamed protein product, partial [Brassica rapa subsp. narinosa]